MLPTDFDRIEDGQKLSLTNQDRLKLRNLKKRECVVKSPSILRELEVMSERNLKAEIQSVTSASLAKGYIRRKIAAGSWV